MKTKLFLPIIFITFMLPLLFCGCNYGGDDDNDYIPIYQDAIYIIDADGSNKQKVIDVDNCDNVQFIPNSNKLLYMADNSLFTVNEDGAENTKISGELEVIWNLRPSVSYDGNYVACNINNQNYWDVKIINLFTNDINDIPLSECQKFYPVFASQNNILCFSNDVSGILTYDIASANIDTVYFTNNYVAGMIFSDDDNDIFFSEYPLNRNLASLKKIDLITFEIELINDNSSSIQAPYMDSIENLIAFHTFNPFLLQVMNFSTLDPIFSTEGYMPNFIDNQKVIYSTKNFSFIGDILLQDFIDNTSSIVAVNSFSPSFSAVKQQIVFLSQYLVNPRNNIYITN